MKLTDFDFDFSKDLIAKYPINPRDNSRLMVYKNSQIKEYIFKDICDILDAGTLLIVNKTKVIPSKLKASLPSGEAIDLNIVKMPKDGYFVALAKPLKKIRKYNHIFIKNKSLNFDIIESKTPPLLKVYCQNFIDRDYIYKNANLQLPPYIKRDLNIKDTINYQTVYSEYEGSFAAPTAGFHFSNDLIEKLKKKGVFLKHILLNIGTGTFLPVRTDNIADHNMHKESYFVPKSTYQHIQKNIKKDYKIIYIGTTTLRCMESFYNKLKYENDICDKWHDTSLYIYPKKNENYKPKNLSALITNFHQPKSSLYILICALIGLNETKNLYKYAIEKKYRLFSYGDSSLIWL
jgi:S-adenosylmethionine:tRNA ribosyltransferase-isomerase